LDTETPSIIKSGILEYRDVVGAMFKDISRDHYLVIEKILHTCWWGIWGDGKVRRTLKIALFQERSLEQVSIFFYVLLYMG